MSLVLLLHCDYFHVQSGDFMAVRFFQRVYLALQTSFGVLRDLVFALLASLLDCGDFAIELDLHRAEGGFERVRILRLDLVDESNNTVVCVEVLAGTLQAAPFADYLGFQALIGHVCQMGLHSFVETSVTTVVETRYLLNQTLSPVTKSLVERVLLLAVVVVTSDGYPVHFILMKSAELSRVECLTAVGVGTRGTLCQIGSGAYTAKTEAAV